MQLKVAKRHKRLWIIDKETDQAVYTPPDFVVLPSRVPMHHLAFDLMRLGRRDINRIASFEWEFSKRNAHRTRNCGAVPVAFLEARTVDAEDLRTGPAR
ncbi:hypothetical protein BDS110ZK1_16580 [Bradyrhizobium diazoefficiens]